MNNFDIAIIGNGILANAIAFQLLLDDPQIKIGIIGPTNFEGGASSAAGAMLGCFGEVSHHTFENKFSKYKLDLSVKAKSYWPDWLNHLSEYSQMILPTVKGTFIILNGKSGILDSHNYQSIIKALNEYHELYEHTDGKDIPGFYPLDDCRPLASIFLPNEIALNVDALAKMFKSVFQRQNTITLIDERVSKLNVEKNIKVITTTNNNIYTAKNVLLAAGAFSQELIDQIDPLKFRIPRLFHGVGISLLLERKKVNIQHVIRTPNRSFACGLHALPRDNQSLYMGSTNNISLYPEFGPKTANLRFLLHCLLQQINQNLHQNTLQKILVGNRPVTFDTFPLLGKTSIPGFYIATGTYREGYLLAPYLAKYMSSLILNNQEIFNNPFLPERLPIKTMSQEQAIETALNNYTSGSFEHETQLPAVGWYEMFKNMLQEKICKLYQEIDCDQFIIPPDLLLMFDEEYDDTIAYFKNYLANVRRAYDKQNVAVS